MLKLVANRCRPSEQQIILLLFSLLVTCCPLTNCLRIGHYGSCQSFIKSTEGRLLAVAQELWVMECDLPTGESFETDNAMLSIHSRGDNSTCPVVS